MQKWNDDSAEDFCFHMLTPLKAHWGNHLIKLKWLTLYYQLFVLQQIYILRDKGEREGLLKVYIFFSPFLLLFQRFMSSRTKSLWFGVKLKAAESHSGWFMINKTHKHVNVRVHFCRKVKTWSLRVILFSVRMKPDVRSADVSSDWTVFKSQNF